MLARLKGWARTVKRDVIALFLAGRDSRTPWYAKVMAGLQIESRPSGAQVWVDGAPAGVTPVVVPSVAAGTHSVRIELSGYQPWSTSVSVTAGQRARVAASLEQ